MNGRKLRTSRQHYQPSDIRRHEFKVFFSQPHSAMLVQSRIRQGLVLSSLCCGCFLFEETRLEKRGQGKQAAEFRMNNKGCGSIKLLSDSENTEQINFRSC